MTAAARIALAGRQVLEGRMLRRDELLSLAQAASTEPCELMHWAGLVRRKHFGNRVSFCSIIPGKLGGCGEDCKWCAQSLVHKGAESQPPHPPGIDPTAPPGLKKKSTRTPLAEIRSAAARAAENRAGCFCIVNSGRRPGKRDLAEVADACRQLHADGLTTGGMRISASLGEIDAESARQLAQAGVRRYNHNLETSRRHYASVVSTHTYDDRLATLQAARQAGMQLCCGGIFGIGETWEDRIDLALTLRDEVRPAISPLNFLHPIAGTPLEHATPLAPMEILTIIAIFRLALPATDLKIAGGRVHNLRDMQGWIFHAGATSCLAGNYLTTQGRDLREDIQMVQDLGLELVPDVSA